MGIRKRSTSFVLTVFIALSATRFAHAQTESADQNSPTISLQEMQAMGFRNAEEMNAYFNVTEVTTLENKRPFTRSELLVTAWSLANGTANEDAAKIKAGSTSVGITDSLTNLLGDLGNVNKWVTLGLKLWDLIKENQPVVNVRTQTVSVLPLAQPDWTQMELWRGPFAKSYTIAAKNLYGATVVSHTYTVAFHYGGKVDGRGSFLANATIIPTAVNVSWGFKLNSDVKIGQPLNTGTKLDPVPGVDMGLEWSMKSILKTSQGVDQFFVRGDGTMSHVSL